jgi:hypothetical protein
MNKQERKYRINAGLQEVISTERIHRGRVKYLVLRSDEESAGLRSDHSPRVEVRQMRIQHITSAGRAR